jgi:hypothetical protein
MERLVYDAASLLCDGSPLAPYDHQTETTPRSPIRLQSIGHLGQWVTAKLSIFGSKSVDQPFP